MVSVLQRARDSGRCPPSLLTEDKEDPDGFENDVTRLLDTAGTFRSFPGPIPRVVGACFIQTIALINLSSLFC